MIRKTVSFNHKKYSKRKSYFETWMVKKDEETDKLAIQHWNNFIDGKKKEQFSGSGQLLSTQSARALVKCLLYILNKKEK